MKHAITRRQFVKGIAATATAPTIISATVLGKDGATAASERITVGQIGCGKFGGKRHLPTLLAMKNVQVVAVCEVDRTRRDDAKTKVEQAYSKDASYQGCAATDDFREILARKDIDAVSIATPDHWHAIPIIEACKAGKDVYCEKPLTLTILEAQRCLEAVKKHERVFQTGSQQRSSEEFRRAAELIRSGRLGDIQRITIGVGKPSRWCDLPEEEMEPGLNWDMWLGQAPTRPYNSILSPRGVHNHFPAWRAYREYSGGAHTDIGAHHYDIAQWALDMDGSGPVEIIPPDNARAGKGVRFIYASGTEMVHGGPSGCEFFGTNGKLYVTRGTFTSDPASILEEPLREDEVHLPVSTNHHRNWVDCIKTRKKCIAPVEAGACSVTVVHLGNAAYWSGKSLKWDPQNWRFVDDDAANRDLLDRERRDPWQLPTV